LASYAPESRAYELMVLLSPELGDEALDGAIERISDQITRTGAEINSVKSTTPWGRRRLAYPIQKHQDAFYLLYSISSEPRQLDPFERDLKLNNSVLRYLLIRQEQAGDEPVEDDAAEAEAEESDEAEPEAEDAESSEAGAEAETDVSEEETDSAPEGADDEEEQT
jgi:small subunit ribosomal protein S6